MCCTLLGQSHAAQLQPSCTNRYKLQLYICINGLRTPGYSEFKWPGKTVNQCDIYPDFLQQWRRIQDHNPHFVCGTPLIFIRMGRINERGTICHCEEAHLIWLYVNIEYLHKQDTFTFTHMFVPFCVFPITHQFWGSDDMLSKKYSNLHGQFSGKHKLKIVQSNDTFQSKFHTTQTPAELHLKMKELGSSKTSVPIYQVATAYPRNAVRNSNLHMLNSKDTISLVLTVNI
jgi:hypothetical protein